PCAALPGAAVRLRRLVRVHAVQVVGIRARPGAGGGPHRGRAHVPGHPARHHVGAGPPKIPAVGLPLLTLEIGRSGSRQTSVRGDGGSLATSATRLHRRLTHCAPCPATTTKSLAFLSPPPPTK